MTAVNTLSGTALYIKVGDDASPETYAHPCLINARRGISFRSKNNELITPDCTNPDDPAWTQVRKDGLSAVISGAGVLDNVLATIQAYDAWFRGDNFKSVRVYLGTVGYWHGEFKLTQWEVTGERGDNVNVNIELQSHGALNAFTNS